MLLEDLPGELLVEIAEHLASEYGHGSLANLAQTSHRFRNASLPTLHRTLILFRTDNQLCLERTVQLPEL